MNDTVTLGLSSKILANDKVTFGRSTCSVRLPVPWDSFCDVPEIDSITSTSPFPTEILFELPETFFVTSVSAIPWLLLSDIPDTSLILVIDTAPKDVFWDTPLRE